MRASFNTGYHGRFSGVIDATIAGVQRVERFDGPEFAFTISNTIGPHQVGVFCNEAEARQLLLQLNRALGNPLAPRLPGVPTNQEKETYE